MWDHMWDEGWSAGVEVEVEVEVAGPRWRGNDTEELQQQ
jgi:hypothetical protein